MSSTNDFTAGLTGQDLIDALRDRVRELETILGAVWRAPRVLRLTPTEERLLGAFAAHRKRLSSEALYNIVYGPQINPPEPGIVGVLIFRIRRKLAPHDVVIVSKWGYGFEIDADNMERLNALYAEGERA